MKYKLISIILLLVLCSSWSYAVSIGISPGRVSFNNLLKNGYAERTVRITTNSEQEVTGHFEISGDIAEWLRFEPNSTVFSVSSVSPYPLKIIISPPNDTRSDSYSGKINFVTDRFGAPSGRAGGIVKAAVTLTLSASVTDIELIACRAGAFTFKDIEIGYPLEMLYQVTNDGNVRINPSVSFDIWDQLQENLIFSDVFTSEEILPTVEDTIVKKLSYEDIPVGQYWANVEIEDCDAGSFVSFNVVEKGGIIDKGILEKILNKVWAYTDEPVEISATFTNTGPRIVSSQFKGHITLDGKIVHVIETEEIDVASKETVELTTIFVPPKPGRYVVTGRINYNKKLTFEKGNVINVTPRPDEKPRFFLLLIYLILIITILFFVRKIVKNRKRI